MSTGQRTLLPYAPLIVFLGSFPVQVCTFHAVRVNDMPIAFNTFCLRGCVA